MTTKKDFPFLVFVIGVLVIWCAQAIAGAQGWQELKGEHFIIYFTQDRKYAKDVLDKAEKYYKKIASELGYQRYTNFWHWDKRVKVYIYPNRDSYRAFVETHGYARWSAGMVKYETKEIMGYANNEEFLDAILPHEITHLIFRDYVGQRNIPVWIDEGVAQWQEKGRRQIVRKKIKQLLQSHSPIPIERMAAIDIGAVKNNAIVELFYAEAISIINFLVKEFGAENFIFFCRQLRDGKDMDEALKFAYPASMRSVRELEAKWLEYVQK